MRLPNWVHRRLVNYVRPAVAISLLGEPQIAEGNLLIVGADNGIVLSTRTGH
jgi:hypothetical protein